MRLFESRLRSDKNQAKALELLHDQLQDYKANFIRQAMLPLLRDVIDFHDFAAEESKRTNGSTEDGSVDPQSKAFDHLRQRIVDVLEKYDVEAYRIPGPEFDRRAQHCVRTLPTNDESDDKKVASVGPIGFRNADSIIRKEQVIVFKYAPGL